MTVENEVNVFFPIETQVRVPVPPVPIGGSLKNLLETARQKPAEPKPNEQPEFDFDGYLADAIKRLNEAGISQWISQRKNVIRLSSWNQRSTTLQ